MKIRSSCALVDKKGQSTKLIVPTGIVHTVLGSALRNNISALGRPFEKLIHPAG